MVTNDIISTRHIASSEVISLRISNIESASRLDATLAVSESTCVEMDGEPTNNWGGKVCLGGGLSERVNDNIGVDKYLTWHWHRPDQTYIL